jgi:hypothetical protein
MAEVGLDGTGVVNSADVMVRLQRDSCAERWPENSKSRRGTRPSSPFLLMAVTIMIGVRRRGL